MKTDALKEKKLLEKILSLPQDRIDELEDFIDFLQHKSREQNLTKAASKISANDILLTGLIAGLVVSGFGLASAYIAPLATYMQRSLGIGPSMLWLGVAFLIVVVSLSQLLVDPPPGYDPEVQPRGAGANAKAVLKEYSWKEMMGTPVFWVIWFIYFIGAGAGLMVIGAVHSKFRLSRRKQTERLLRAMDSRYFTLLALGIAALIALLVVPLPGDPLAGLPLALRDACHFPVFLLLTLAINGPDSQSGWAAAMYSTSRATSGPGQCSYRGPPGSKPSLAFPWRSPR